MNVGGILGRMNEMKSMRDQVASIAGRLMAQPAVAYQESRVAAVVREICDGNGLPHHTDKFGNIHIRTAAGSGNHKSRRPICFVAHMDHPGFEVVSGNREKNALKVRFLGGVPDRYFVPGTPVTAWPGNIKGTLGEKLPGRKIYRVHIPDGYAGKPELVVWDLRNFQKKGDRIHGRACDDLMGLSAMLAGLIAHAQAGGSSSVQGLVTRAEEVGFQGALACASSGILPSDGLYISLETSKELPPVKMGKGVIIRTGDRLSQFDSQGVYFLTRVAEDLAGKDSSFKFQKALMPGGACEATAFSHCGLTSAAMCIPLGNYHNCGPGDRISEEFVSLSDASGMADMVLASGNLIDRFDHYSNEARKRLDTLTSEAISKLTSK